MKRLDCFIFFGFFVLELDVVEFCRTCVRVGGTGKEVCCLLDSET